MQQEMLDVVCVRLDKWNTPTKEYTHGNNFRISVYWDYTRDNYHTQFPERSDKPTVAKQLHQLADLIQRSIE